MYRQPTRVQSLTYSHVTEQFDGFHFIHNGTECSDSFTPFFPLLVSLAIIGKNAIHAHLIHFPSEKKSNNLINNMVYQFIHWFFSLLRVHLCGFKNDALVVIYQCAKTCCEAVFFFPLFFSLVRKLKCNYCAVCVLVVCKNEWIIPYWV